MDDYSTDSDSAGEQETKPGSPQGTSRLSHSGQGLQGRKLQLGYGGGVQGAGVSFRTPEQEAAEDARRMRLFRGMQATVVLSVLSAALMITVAIVEANAASGCSVEGAVTRTEHFELTVDTMIGLQLLSASTFAGGITVLRNKATQGRPIVTVSAVLFARNDAALEQLAATASIAGDALDVTVEAPDSALEAATRCAWGMVTIKLPALSPGWAPISPRLVAEIGATEDHEVAQTYQEVSWPWTVSGLGAVMSDGPGAQEGELTNWADFDAAAPGIEVRASRASEPMEFESLSLRTSHGGIRLSNVAWLAGNGAAPAVIAQAFAGAIVVDGLSAAADAETFHSRGRLTFWAKEGDAKISRVQVSGPTLLEVQSMLGSVWVNDVRLHARDSNDDGVPDNDNAGGPGVEDRLRVVGKSLKGDVRVGLASSAGAIGGGSFELRAPFGSVALSQSRLMSALTVDEETGGGVGRLNKLGVDTAALENEYGTSLRRESLLENDSEDLNHASAGGSNEGWKGASELPLASSRGGMVRVSNGSPMDVPRWEAESVAEVSLWSGAVHGVASLTIVEELAPTADGRATAAYPPM